MGAENCNVSVDEVLSSTLQRTRVPLHTLGPRMHLNFIDFLRDSLKIMESVIKVVSRLSEKFHDKICFLLQSISLAAILVWLLKYEFMAFIHWANSDYTRTHDPRMLDLWGRL